MKYLLAVLPVAIVLSAITYYSSAEPHASAQSGDRAENKKKWEYCTVIRLKTYDLAFQGMPDTFNGRSTSSYSINMKSVNVGPLTLKEAFDKVGVKGPRDSELNLFNGLGVDGWELVNRCDNAYGKFVRESYVFKRLLQ